MLNLIIQICGIELFVLLCALSIILIIGAFFLSFVVKNEQLVAAYLPLTILPALAGAIGSLVSCLNTINMSLNLQEGQTSDSAFLLQMSIVPILAGIVAGIPAALISMVGRLQLTLAKSGVVLFKGKKKEPESEAVSARKAMEQDADEYLERLVRPK